MAAVDELTVSTRQRAALVETSFPAVTGRVALMGREMGRDNGEYIYISVLIYF